MGRTVAQTNALSPFTSLEARNLVEFLRYPSVSSDPHRAADVGYCAAWLSRHLRSIGLREVRIVPTKRHPFVYGEWRGALGQPTLLLYGHYDVQPPGPPRAWKSSPFEAVARGQELFGRGASDDKGQLFAHVKAIESYLQTSRRLPLNVRCIFDGEEEVGSLGLVDLVRRRPQDFEADAAVVSDTPFLA